MASGFQKFIEDNTKGAVNKGFLALSIAEIATADNKLKALLKTIALMAVQGIAMKVIFAGAFGSMSKSIRALVRDTGALQAALDRLRKIQGWQHTFAPLVGGVKVARLEVARLLAFASSNNLKVEGVMEAAQTLQVLTHGAFASEEALKLLAETGAATGNSLTAAAEGAGQFVADLREGRPIDAAVENMRAMGLISDESAKGLLRLAQSGASTMAVMEAFKGVLAGNKGALAAMKGEIAAVENRYENARRAMLEKLGAPFTEAEIQNMANMADVMTALVPHVERLANFFAKLINTFSTAATGIAKWVAENRALMDAIDTAIEIIGVFIAVVSGISAIGLAAWCISAAFAVEGLVASLIAATGAAGAAATAIEALGVAAEIALGATALGLFIILGVQLYGIYLNWAHGAEKAADAQRSLREAHDATTAAMEKQIRAARNLQEAHEATAKAAKSAADAYKDLQDARHEQVDAHKNAEIIRNSGQGKLGYLDLLAHPRAMMFGLKNIFSGRDSDDTGDQDAKYGEGDRDFRKKRDLANMAIENEKRMMRGEAPMTVDARDRTNINLDHSIAKATLRGDREHVVSLGNLKDYGSNFEQVRGVLGDKNGAQAALDMTRAQIMQNAAAPAADHLAKLGLGGNFGGGDDIQKQMRDLQREYLPFLRMLGAKGVEEIKASNKPQSTDDNPI